MDPDDHECIVAITDECMDECMDGITRADCTTIPIASPSPPPSSSSSPSPSSPSSPISTARVAHCIRGRSAMRVNGLRGPALHELFAIMCGDTFFQLLAEVRSYGTAVDVKEPSITPHVSEVDLLEAFATGELVMMGMSQDEYDALPEHLRDEWISLECESCAAGSHTQYPRRAYPAFCIVRDINGISPYIDAIWVPLAWRGRGITTAFTHESTRLATMLPDS